MTGLPSSGAVTAEEIEGKLESLWDCYTDLYERIRQLEEAMKPVMAAAVAVHRALADMYPG